MFLKVLSILSFKGIEEATCYFSPKLNCFFGGNGMGKTNLLDAIHYLSIVRSHIGTTDRLSVKKGAEVATLYGTYVYEKEDETNEPERIALKIRVDKPKLLSRNGKTYTRLSDHIGTIPVVIVSPQDYKLIRGGSQDRRTFIDRLLSQLDKEYLQALVAYDHSLIQRNNMLRKTIGDNSLYEIIEEQMARTAILIRTKRVTFIERFKPIFEELYSKVSGVSEAVSISYLTSVPYTQEEFTEQLRTVRNFDLSTGTTSVGTHKDDFGLYLGDELMRKIGSEGQNKTFLIGLKFAEYMILSEQKGVKPILLLDDLFDKLDRNRVRNIIDLVSQPQFGQIFITDTNRKLLDDMIEAEGENYKLFELYKGTVKAL